MVEQQKEGEIDLYFKAKVRNSSVNNAGFEITIPKPIAECGKVQNGKRYLFKVISEIKEEPEATQ